MESKVMTSAGTKGKYFRYLFENTISDYSSNKYYKMFISRKKWRKESHTFCENIKSCKAAAVNVLFGEILKYSCDLLMELSCNCTYV